MNRRLLLPLVALLSACATTKAVPAKGPPAEVLQFEPVVVTAGDKLEMELAGYNDEELFAVGTSAYAQEDYDKAARCFTRLADTFPASKHVREALYNAGLAYERLQKFDAALQRFLPLMDPENGKGDALDASFRVAECYYHLDDYKPAVEILAKVAVRDDIPFQDKLMAKVQKAVCLIEEKDLDQAEKDLRVALKWWEEKKDSEALDDYFPAQAQFFIGEIYRLYMEAVELDPNGGTDKLGKDLEYKCELLLSAQGHYLRAIRIGNGQWATASGFRIGALYENLYDGMLNARVPAEFDSEQAEVYREELRKKVRVLVTKAMAVYERTLAAAERIGVDNPFVAKTRQSLDRMKQLLLEDSARESASPSHESTPEPAKNPSSAVRTIPRHLASR